ncbi:cation transporter [Campylobacter jejuni]|nr:cation transporter [Campylobacter jejuni]EGJ7060345.1 cation transporter [Campylobacter jejuni]EHN0336217.1 CDF family cation-efflux transporter CzcD [Campylobacter jejuni]EJB2210822.1 CDF family cation-efflux transporter CzcD [Campylobacter jejuni]ELZ6654300.1 CDF family cation-efflux transporter CzcD [Campylobacter jejuni]
MYKFLSHEPLANKSCHHNHEEHSHEHHHSHADARSVDKKILKISLLMTFSMMLVQFIYSILSNSLALLSDTLHMFSDVFALTLSFLAIIAVEKWQDHQKTFGYFRLEVLVAFINALTIILSALFIIYEAIEKFINPKEIDAKTMIIVAILGFLVNGINALMMFKGANLENVNMKSAFLHMMSDLLGSLAVIIGGIVVYFSDIVYIDTILAIVLSILLLRWAIILLKQSANVLLESSPVDIEKVRQVLLLNPSVDEVVDLHITQITNKMLVASMHLKVRVCNLKEFEKLSQDLSHKLLHEFEIGHITIQPIRSENEI